MPPFDYERIAPGALHFEGREGILYGNDEPFDIKGVNWFGSENRAGPPLGLDKHAIAWYMKWLKENKFNAIRLLFNHQMVLSNTPLEPPNTEIYGADAPWESPELANLNYIDMFDKIAEVAEEHGILILMAAHRLGPTDWPGNGLWYNEATSEENVKQSWELLANKLCGRWTVFAADLQNEPHSSSWGKGDDATDWGRGAERLGDHVLTHCARWLIFVEGVGYTPGAKGYDSSGAGIWWGENLVGAQEQPISLMDNSKLVYSPHTYGPSVYPQFYFADATFPNNMAAIWKERFEFLREVTGSPIVIGEMGGHYTGNDKTWQDWAAAFMRQKRIGIFYFALLVGAGPQNDDTGGLLKGDWTTPEAEKLAMLSTLPSTDVLALKSRTSPPPPRQRTFEPPLIRASPPLRPPPPSLAPLVVHPPPPSLTSPSPSPAMVQSPPCAPSPAAPLTPPQFTPPPPIRDHPFAALAQNVASPLKDSAILGAQPTVTGWFSGSQMAFGLGFVFFFSCVGIFVLARKIGLAQAKETGSPSTPRSTPKRAKKAKKPSRAERGQRLATEEPPEDVILGDDGEEA